MGAAGADAAGARLSSHLQGKAASPIFRLKEELVGIAMIVRLSVAWPAGRAGDEEGAVRLLGCGAGAGRAIRAWPAMAMQVVAREMRVLLEHYCQPLCPRLVSG